ncbi:MAG TPA: pyridoxamine 5'-phosphate oxidase family protein [Chitinophagaceae bacterium]
MFGKLNDEEMQEALHQQIYGHLGCNADGVTYVVPISYAYDGQSLYCHSGKGMKITMMQKNPEVCFQVDVMESMANWKSVILWGSFEVLPPGPDRDKAITVLLERHTPHPASQTFQLSSEWPFTPEHLEAIGGLIFRIRITRMTGRYERISAPAYHTA